MSSRFYPRNVSAAANRLAQNQDLKVLAEYHIKVLTEALTDAEKEQEILSAHAELNMFKNFLDTLATVGNENAA